MKICGLCSTKVYHICNIMSTVWPGWQNCVCQVACTLGCPDSSGRNHEHEDAFGSKYIMFILFVLVCVCACVCVVFVCACACVFFTVFWFFVMGCALQFGKIAQNSTSFFFFSTFFCPLPVAPTLFKYCFIFDCKETYYDQVMSLKS